MSNFYKSAHLVLFQPATSTYSPVHVFEHTFKNRHMQATNPPADACVFLSFGKIFGLSLQSLLLFLSSLCKSLQVMPAAQNQ